MAAFLHRSPVRLCAVHCRSGTWEIDQSRGLSLRSRMGLVFDGFSVICHPRCLAQVAEHLPLSWAAPQRYPREVFDGTARTDGQVGRPDTTGVWSSMGSPSFVTPAAPDTLPAWRQPLVTGLEDRSRRTRGGADEISGALVNATRCGATTFACTTWRQKGHKGWYKCPS
jgi:hypothetical protein